ncbi:MAG: hypothetical protein ACI8TQ_003759 [Planctomycetota bacterium]|jgi:hypothetical protein
MDTLLSQFCTEFDTKLRPLLDPLEDSSKAIQAAEDGMPGKVLLPELLDLGLQFRALVDKVAEQQAYVLIFGPLKSGKSTLMNSVCAAYVSEVTALPAYPCMVFVSHSESLHFIVTRYNGEVQHFTDPSALRLEINRAHSELADKIREVERGGEVFEPAVHFAKAIRRVDVKVPAGELEQSGAVLVDTPGLYARMKFGYDQMTRDFRNAAACAIFVVKSDNLFLEQVFSEFAQLLELFSRIFLVVNLDSGKRDLQPDGSLAPSLESADPQRIIEAFQSLSMSAPLKAAADEGRLRIYPVDLLQAASRRILEVGGRAHEAQFDSAMGHGEANFEAFIGDLTEYLNSTEYLVAFLSDSLRRASSLLSETHSLLQHRCLGELSDRVRGLERDLELSKARLEALERLGDFDWQAAFEELKKDLEVLTREWARGVEEATAVKLEKTLSEWFKNDESLQHLVVNGLKSALSTHKQKLGERLYDALSERVGRGAAGIMLSEGIEADLHAAEIQLDQLGLQSLAPLDARVLGAGVKAPFDLDDVPVKKAVFWDWLTMKSRGQVRRRLFGPAERPSLAVPVATKTKRLGLTASEALQDMISVHVARFFPDCVRGLCGDILGNYAVVAAERVSDQLEAEAGKQRKELAIVESRLLAHRSVLERLNALGEQVELANGTVETLSEQYGNTEPVKLIEPFPSPEPEMDDALELNDHDEVSTSVDIDLPDDASRVDA